MILLLHGYNLDNMQDIIIVNELYTGLEQAQALVDVHYH